VPQVRQPFVSAVLGGDPRKNAERLFEAWARAGRGRQLVVTNSIDPGTRARWESVIESHGLVVDDDVVLTDWQPDDVLRALYQRCELFVFPSLYEGAGLPVAEAVACGAPAITSATSSMPEVLDLPESTFDPESVEDMAAMIGRALEDESFREQLRRRGAERAAQLTWDSVARRTVDALATIPDGPRAELPWRLALVGPMMPTPSGIADYNTRLLPALAERCEVDVFTTVDRHPEAPEGVRWFPPRALKETCSPWAYDAVVYTAGNSDHHHDLYDLAQEFPGVLWLHDVRLPGLYVTYAHDRVSDAWEDFLRERLLRQYRRRLPLHVRDDVDRTPGQLNELGLGLAKELADVARAVVVSSHLAARLLQLDLQPDSRVAPTHVLPLAVPPPWDAGVTRERATIVSMGMVSPIKATELLVTALGDLRAGGTDARLVLVGPVPEQYRPHLDAHIAAVGVAEHVTITDHVDDATYRDWLARATVAVQLRLSTNGESSAAVTDCLAAGLPVVTNVHAATELPPGTVSLVPGDVDAPALAAHLAALLADPDALAALADGGRRFARSWGFGEVADRLLNIVRTLPPR
jgi:glycosyltransferase involved in cell wall biosynthesis